MTMQHSYQPPPLDPSLRQDYRPRQDFLPSQPRHHQYYDAPHPPVGYPHARQHHFAQHPSPPSLSTPPDFARIHPSADPVSSHYDSMSHSRVPPPPPPAGPMAQSHHGSYYTTIPHHAPYLGSPPHSSDLSPPTASHPGPHPANGTGPYTHSHANPGMHSPTASSSKSQAMQPAASTKAVVRAACLSCRSAKRRCDGGQPICGPCLARGITETGGCQYVASKRGGPRFKGCTGEEARRIKADKERQRMEQVRKMSTSPDPPPTHTAGASRHGHSDRRQPAQDDEGLRMSASSHLRDSIPRQSSYNGGGGDSTASLEASTPFSRLSSIGTPAHSSTSTDHAAIHPSFLGPPPHDAAGAHTLKPAAAAAAASDHNAPIRAQWAGPAQPRSALDFLQKIATPLEKSAREAADDFPMWSMGDGVAPPSNGFAALLPDENLGGFYSRLELLPKAGVPETNGQQLDVGNIDFDAPLPFDPELEPHLLDAADSEQQARFLLTAFFDKVYASAPVLLAPENLSSLAFWFSGKGPCALYAAISALVTLRLPEHEAQRTLRGGYHKAAGEEAKEGWSRAEVAAHHARVSDFLLKRFSQQQAAAAAASFGLDPKALSTGCDPDETGRSLCQGPSDPELLRIEAAAAHTLLAHYFYGAGGKGSQRKAHDHALEAWGSLQGIRIELQEGIPPKDPLTTSHFNWDQKQEWAKRVYWTSYAAASVTAATGGFQPITFTLDAVAALKLRPALESDVGAWGVYIRGAQHVARGYAALHAFEALKAQRELPQDEVAREKARIFHSFSKLDQDMTAFCTYDPAWRSPTSPTSGLGFALRTAGKLMTAGATIIIHRGQAYANAQIFMNAQCGLPEAGRTKRESGEMFAPDDSLSLPQASGHHRAPAAYPVRGGGPDEDEPGSPSDSYAPPDRLWHRSGSTSLPPAGSGSGSISLVPHPSAVDPSVAALDAKFLDWGPSPHPHAAAAAAASAASPYEGPTKTAMLAFQQFQAQQSAQGFKLRLKDHKGRNGSGSSASGGQMDEDMTSLRTPPPMVSSEDAHERYKYGPFEPEVSASKCRWAANSMLESVPPLLQGSADAEGEMRDAAGGLLSSAPALPPWAACSYVLACYCLLMQCLVTQSSHATGGQDYHGEGAVMAPGARSVNGELQVLRGQVIAIHNLLARFAQTINVAREYKNEVSVLLEINRRLT
ncbi:unnamed protein product [Parajaminaea phylloscopi]